jgi:hypothetical protein
MHTYEGSTYFWMSAYGESLIVDRLVLCLLAHLAIQ